MRTTGLTTWMRLAWALLFAVAMSVQAAGVSKADASKSDASKAGVSKADAQKVRGVIQAQLAAFAADDAKRAFSHAAPGIRQMFGTPERFLEMVRQGYPVVYRPASVSFLAPERAGATVFQAVEMADSNGALWVAVYALERQRSGVWRISGCEVLPRDGRAI